MCWSTHEFALNDCLLICSTTMVAAVKDKQKAHNKFSAFLELTGIGKAKCVRVMHLTDFCQKFLCAQHCCARCWGI